MNWCWNKYASRQGERLFFFLFGRLVSKSEKSSTIQWWTEGAIRSVWGIHIPYIYYILLYYIPYLKGAYIYILYYNIYILYIYSEFPNHLIVNFRCIRRSAESFALPGRPQIKNDLMATRRHDWQRACDRTSQVEMIIYCNLTHQYNNCIYIYMYM